MLITAVTLAVYALASVFVKDRTVLFGLGAMTVFSIPMCVGDFQCYYLPKVSSVLFEIMMAIVVPFIFGATSYLEWGKMLGVYLIAAVVLTILCLLTNFGFADAYVGAWIAIPLFLKPELLLPTLIAYLVSTIVLIVLTFITRGRKITHVPYVPALIWTIPLVYVVAGIM